MYQSLIVEDDPQVAYIHSGYLERSGFSVAGVAADGRQAIELLHRQPVQLVLLDIYLPGASGLQLLRELRAAGQEVEVIIVSAPRTAPRFGRPSVWAAWITLSSLSPTSACGTA